MIAWVALGLVVARWAASLWLSRLNARHVSAHAGSIPPAFVDVVDEPTYARSVEYTLARLRFGQVSATFGLVVLLAALFSGVLPAVQEWFVDAFGSGVWSMAGFLFTVGAALSLVTLPLGWYSQFRLEERFGFNTTTPATWWTDLVKRLLVSLVVLLPLLALVLAIIGWAGRWWWVWAWVAMTVFELVVTVLAPILILPLFNRLTPLPEGSLSERLTSLAVRARFPARSIQVMDGSRRSRHSNAFFTGFGRRRRIVLFDTVIEQAEDSQIEAVLAHEVGHSKRRHVVKMLFVSSAGSLFGLWVVARVAARREFVEAFGFEPSTGFTAVAVAPVLLLFGLLAGALTFWVDPAANWLSRRYEYQADAYALAVIGDPAPMVGALRKLSEKNLSNLTPHPIYSRWYYSHPTLLERETALGR
jgi:STE24 endopeptidase